MTTECRNHCVSSVGRDVGQTTGAPTNNDAPGCGSKPKEERFSTFHPGVELYPKVSSLTVPNSHYI